MTINLTIINPFGVWQGSDHRLTDPNTRLVVDDYSIKHVIIRCPDGAALLAYAGIGKVKNLDISDWIRETLRGENRTLDQSFILIRENSTRDLGQLLYKHSIPHMYSIGAFLNGQPWCIQIRNFNSKAGVPDGSILNHFITAAKPIENSGQSFIFGDGEKAIPKKDRTTFFEMASRKPRQPKEFRDLLATIIRRSAKNMTGEKSISSSCVITYMPPTGEPFESKFYGGDKTHKPLITPMLLFGIDLTELQRGTIGNIHSKDSTKSTKEKSFDDFAENSVSPKNRLRQ